MCVYGAQWSLVGQCWKLVDPGGTPLVLSTEEVSAGKETKKMGHEGTGRMGIRRDLKSCKLLRNVQLMRWVVV